MRDLATFPSLEDAWEQLGRALSLDQQSLQLIKHKFPTPAKQQKELFLTYLKTNVNPNWTDIINALVAIGKQAIARQVVDTLELPQEILVTATDSSASSGTAGLASVRVSKTEIHAYKAVGHSDSDKLMLKSRVVSDDGAISLAEKTTTALVPATFPRINKTELLTSTSKGAVGHPQSDLSKPFTKSCVVSDDGATEETDGQFESQEDTSSTSFPLTERRLKGSHLESDSGQIFDDPNEDKQSSESFSSDDFHSAEETPVDVSEKSTIEYDELISQSHVNLKVILKTIRNSMTLDFTSYLCWYIFPPTGQIENIP